MPSRRRRRHAVCSALNQTSSLSLGAIMAWRRYVGMHGAAASGSAIHPVFTLDQAFMRRVVAGESFKIGPAVSLTPKGGRACFLLDISRRWSSTHIRLTLMPLIPLTSVH